MLFAVRESRLAERIRREESVSARVPVRRVSRVRGVIEDGERHRLAVDRASQHHPSRPCAPHLVAGLALAAAIAPGDSGVVQFEHRFGAPAAVGEDFRLLRWMLERACHANAEGALFRVVEDDPRVARDPARDPIHRA